MNVVLYNLWFPFPYPKTTANIPQQWLKLWQFQNKTYEGIAEGEVRIPVNPVSDGNDPLSVNYHNLSLYIYIHFSYHKTSWPFMRRDFVDWLI